MPEVPPEQPWPVSVLVQLGKQLAEVLVRAVQMPSSLAVPRGPRTLIPVLYHVYAFRSFRQVCPRWGSSSGVPQRWEGEGAPQGL